MRILNGKKIAQAISRELKKKIVQGKTKPGLGVVLVGDDKASRLYVSLKQKAAKEIGMKFKLIKLPEKTGEKEILEEIKKLNNDKNIHGIIVQLPLPKNINKQKIISAINPKNDVDGFHKENIKLFLAGKERFVPVFPGAILELIKSSKKDIRGGKALVIANSDEFGKVMVVAASRLELKAEYILQKDLKKNSEKIKNADVVITACGVPGLITGKMLKTGAVVIDGGISKIGKKTLGDVDFKSTKKLSGFLSPVPGGVGPVTVAMLLKNTFETMKKFH